MKRTRRTLHALSLAATLAAAVPAPAQEADTARLDTVTVTSRTESALVTPMRTVDVIDRAEIAATPARTIADVLAMRLGVDVAPRSPAQADLALRGSSIEQVLVMVDGVPVSDVQAGHFDLDLAVPLDMVERIEVLRGTGSTLYGSDAVGGVVNIVTRRDAHAADADVSGGSFGTAGGSLFLADTAHAWAVRVGARGERSDGHRSDTDYRLGEGNVSLARELGEGRLRADVGVGIRSFGAGDFYGPYPSYERTGAATAAARWAAPLGRRWGLTATVDTRRHSDDFTLVRGDPALYRNRHLSWQSGAEVVTRWAAMPGVTVALGADGRDDQLASARLGDHTDDRGALFAEATLGHAGESSLDAGVRGDWSSIDGGFASPSLAAAVPVARWATLRASVGRGFRAPTWTERYYEDPANIGDAALRPETFWAGEVGVRLVPAGRARIDVALFARRARDLIDWAKPVGAPDSLPWHAMNVESATYRGAELVAEVPRLLDVDWELRASALSFGATGASGFVGKYALDPVTRSLSLSATLPVTARTAVSVDALAAHRAEEGSFAQVNARVAWQLHATSLYVDGMNLGDSRHLDAAGLPVAGRAVYVGLGWSLK